MVPYSKMMVLLGIFILKHGRIYGDINTFIQYPDSGDYETDATSLSVEYNKRIAQKNGMFFEPPGTVHLWAYQWQQLWYI